MTYTLPSDGRPLRASEGAFGAESSQTIGNVSTGLLDFPPEILLHIHIPDLDVVAQAAPSLVPLTTDPVMHTHRLKIVYPSRVEHALFARGPVGDYLRPTVGDLVHRGVMKGLAIERQWRMGAYFYSRNAIVQYENSRALARRHASHVLKDQLRRRIITSSVATTKANAPHAISLHALYSSHVLPDVESSSPNVARSLLPIVRKLKWSLQRDRLAKVFKDSGIRVGIGAWLESGKGDARKVVQEGDKLRLAVCPPIRTRLGFFEGLGRAN
ncbi:hypothetical protein D9613_004272 [Agrocybe pediades]|uniref:Uncharacterized protein n=1 Tax=Agrocybe pediades TaxID=84607 RepID=A0A8H4QK88_9AGAR|nr:hypothetical protein D9613_004272 [Agrocybe pediades]